MAISQVTSKREILQSRNKWTLRRRGGEWGGGIWNGIKLEGRSIGNLSSNVNIRMFPSGGSRLRDWVGKKKARKTNESFI